MNMKRDKLSDPNTILQKAEKILRKKNPSGSLPLSETEMAKLIHKLELQNEELRLRDNTLVQITDNVPACIALVNPELKYTFVNSIYESFFGRKKQDIIGKRVIDVIGAEAFERALPNIVRAQAGETITFDNHLLNARGEDRIIQTTYEPFFRKDKIIGLLILVIDITDRKHSEQLLNQSEEKYKLLFENMSQGVFYQKSDGTLADVNPAALEMFGLTKEQLIGRNSFHPDWNIVDENYRVLSPGQHPSMKAFQTAREQQQVVGVFNPVKKYYIWLSVSAKPLFRDGQEKPVEVFVTMHDITGLKQAEETLRDVEENHRVLLDGSSDPIFAFNPDGQYRYVNKAFADGVGLKTEDIIGKRIWDIFSLDEAEKRFAAVKWVFANNAVKVIEVRVPRPQGDKFYITTVKPVPNESGTVISVICISKDITGRMEAEKNQAQLNQQLTDLNTTKDKLFSIIAHDLRSPFSIILGFSELLSDNLESYTIKQSEDYIRRIYSTAKYTLELLENLLNWAKTQTGQLDFYPEKIVMQPLIQQAVNVFESAAKIKNISLNCSNSDDLAVFTDKNMLKTMLWNLISNAIKFTNPGGMVNISVVPVNDNIEIRVVDNGVGIPPETLEILFNNNAGITTRGTSNEKGSGLGLILCREFLNILGGTIRAESEAGKGSKFCITLPSD